MTSRSCCPRREGHRRLFGGLLVAILLGAGCSLGYGDLDGDGYAVVPPLPKLDGGASDDAAESAVIDGSPSAGDSGVFSYLGSPLCRASRSFGACYPDDVPEAGLCSVAAPPPIDADAAASPPDATMGGAPSDAGTPPPADAAAAFDSATGEEAGGASEDAAGAVDGGSAWNDGAVHGQAHATASATPATADAGDEPLPAACRVVADGGVAGPACELAGLGGDGFFCRTGADCAAQFDCVSAGDAGGVCRRYCCDNVCGDGGTSAGGGVGVTPEATFCSIASLFATTPELQVPVCLPVAHCTLLAPSGCASGSTCSVVAGDGTTSCVAVGPAAEGEQCETQLCGSGLACLGVFGQRTCFQLCTRSDAGACNPDAGGACCPSGEACTTSQPQFPDPGIGVCSR